MLCEYQHYNHSLGLAIVHLVWIPKRRSKILVGDVKTRLIQICQEVAVERAWEIVTLNVDPGYVYLSVKVPPTDAINQIVNAFKHNSSMHIRKEFPHVGRMPSMWTSKYFFSTAGDIPAATIEQYINDPQHV